MESSDNSVVSHTIPRRTLLQAAASLSLAAATKAAWPLAQPDAPDQGSLTEFSHAQVLITGALQTAQRENVLAVLTALDEDSLLYPYRHMSGQPTPGVSLTGWYEYLPKYDHHHDTAGLAPGHALGQWISALARFYAASTFNPGETQPTLAARVRRLTALLSQSVTPDYFTRTRFPAYTLDKLICGLLDAQIYTADVAAFPTIDQSITAATPSLPGHAIEREVQWKLGYDISWMWDENYTLPENLYRAADIAAQRGQGSAAMRYRTLADAYLLDKTFFEPLSRNQNALSDLHAYSHVNALCSAAQCFLSTGSQMHLAAAVNGFTMLEAQSYATGGWGPDETLRKPGLPDLYNSLTNTHNSFETPCGAYAHLKLTRYLLRATRDGRYGDSMERVFFNTILGALPLQPTGRSYYHSDYGLNARRVYSPSLWPCCSGTLPQVVADYGINTYLQSPDALWINLYQPSQLHATLSHSEVLLTQTTDYPFDPRIHLTLQPSRPITFTLHLRIPAWAEQPTLAINGTPHPITAERGFTAITRLWHPEDTVTLTLPCTLRLGALPANSGPDHANLVALLYGPIVLFALHQAVNTTLPSPAALPYSPPPAPQPAPITLPRTVLLAARRTAAREWTVTTPTQAIRFVPFPDLADHPYTTYVNAQDS
jgi:hypothetical protein